MLRLIVLLQAFCTLMAYQLSWNQLVLVRELLRSLSIKSVSFVNTTDVRIFKVFEDFVVSTQWNNKGIQDGSVLVSFNPLSCTTTTSSLTSQMMWIMEPEPPNCPLQINSKLFIFHLEEEHKIVLSEVFSTSTQIEQNVVSSFSVTDGFFKTQTNIWWRRSDLKGRVFKTGVIKWSPYITKITRTSSGPIPEGYASEILSVLSRTLNFSMEFIEYSSNRWSKQVDDIASGVLDLGGTNFIQSYVRSKIVDFSHPTTISRFDFFYKRRDEGINWNAYFRSFRPDLWLTLVAYNVLVVLVFFSLNCLSTNSFSLEWLGRSAAITLMSSVGRKSPVVLSPKSYHQIALVVVSFSGFVFISLYTAMLGASLAIHIEVKPFQTMGEIAQSDHKVLVQRSTVDEHTLLSAPEGTDLHTINRRLRQSYDTNIPEMLLGMMNGTYSKHLSLMEFNSAVFNPQWPCYLGALNVPMSPLRIGYLFPKNWPYTELFNFHLKRLEAIGVLRRLRAKHFLGVNQRCSRSLQPVELTDCVSLGFALTGGYVVSLIVFAVEFFQRRRRKLPLACKPLFHDKS